MFICLSELSITSALRQFVGMSVYRSHYKLFGLYLREAAKKFFFSGPATKNFPKNVATKLEREEW